MNASLAGCHHVEQVMGTAVSIDIRDAIHGADAVGDVVRWLHHVDETFSTHRQDSLISAMGRGELSMADSGDEIREVIALCEEARVATEGAFDVFEVPAPNGTRFDPSGLVKGWAIQRAAGLLETHGYKNFCLNAGGDIAIHGRPSSAEPWRIGIRHPVDETAFALVIAAHGRLAVATSAMYERAAHIVDPRNGGSTTGCSTTELVSATVVGPDLATADAYATAAFVMGLDALPWISRQPGYEAYLIAHDDQTYWSPGFTGYMTSA